MSVWAADIAQLAITGDIITRLCGFVQSGSLAVV